jgi:hypothetical protein
MQRFQGHRFENQHIECAWEKFRGFAHCKVAP